MSVPTTAERGRFITLEGIEGVGKSTNLRFVADHLRRAGIDVVVTREPGGVPLAESIRDVLLAADGGSIPTMTELLLMFAARAVHVDHLIRPAIESGKWVVCDRFTDASYAYQGAGRGLPALAIRQLEAMVHGDFQPDLTILLDAAWHSTRARREDRGVMDRFEKEDQRFFDRVRSGYLERARGEPSRIRIVDAGQSLAVVQATLTALLNNFVSDKP